MAGKLVDGYASMPSRMDMRRRLHLRHVAAEVALLVCALFRKNRKIQGMKDVVTRTVIAAVLVSMAVAASAVAVNILQVTDPSVFVLLAASLLALVLLRRRTS